MVRKLLNFFRDLFKLNRAFFFNYWRTYKGKKRLDYFIRFQEIYSSYAPVFVLSTGRSGTKLLTEILEQNKDVAAHHAPKPELIYYSKYAYENFTTQKEILKRVIDSSRIEWLMEAYIRDQIFVETNHLITFFCYQLAEIYPRSKFIHLVRHPASFVRSGISRDWYSGKNPHDIGRITPMDEEKSKWETYTEIQKIGWLWNETNWFIEDFKKQMDESRCLTITSEKMFKEPRFTNDIFRFIGLHPIEESKVRAFIKKPTNKQYNFSLPKYSEWTEKQREELKHVVSGSLLEKYQYQL